MKTITEFSGFTLKEAIAKKAALLAEGKTEEEAQAAVNELLKLDEAKTPFYKSAVDMTSSRIDRVKRVVIAVKANDAEKVPEAFMEREGHFYLVEYFPAADSRGGKKTQESASYFDDFARGGGGGRGRGNDRGRGRGGNDRGRGEGGGDRGGDRRPGRGDRRPPREAGTGSPFAAPSGDQPRRDSRPRRPEGQRDGQRPAGGGERKPRPPRDPNAQRAPRGPRGAGELRLVLKGQTTTLQGSGPSTPEAAPSSTETSAE